MTAPFNTSVGFSFLLYKISNRSDGLFYPLINYDTTYLCKLSNSLDGLFYSLTLDSLFICYASYQIGQIDTFSFWHLTASSLCKISNRSDRLFYSLTLNSFYAISLDWVLIIDIDNIPPKFRSTFDHLPY